MFYSAPKPFIFLFTLLAVCTNSVLAHAQEPLKPDDTGERHDRVVPLAVQGPTKAVRESEPNNNLSSYNPLNNSSDYTVTAGIAQLTDVDFYAVYIKEGSQIDIRAVAAQLTGNANTEFDPTLGLFAPDGALVRTDDDGGRGNGSFWAARINYTATASGVWRIAVSHYNDLRFDGTNTRPSYDPNIPGSGPGVHTGPYQLVVTGAQKPEIIVRRPEGEKVFFIEGSPPRMPELTVQIIGVVPSPVQLFTYRWETQVFYRAGDYPPVSSPSPGRGRGRDIASLQYSPYSAEVGGANFDEFSPYFRLEPFDPFYVGVPRGGTLVFSFQTSVGDETITTRTPDSGNDRLQILGRNPDRATVSAYVNTLPVPEQWPTDTQYNYHVIFRKIISKESGIQQFLLNVPLWSTDGARGVGLMQLTKPAPTDDEVWDWRRNLNGGDRLIRTKLEEGGRSLNNLFNQVQREAAQMGAQAAPITGDMVALQTVRAFNGFNNGAGFLNEWRPVRNSQGRLVISDGMTSWERVPVSVRGTSSGNANYVNDVLGEPDF